MIEECRIDNILYSSEIKLHSCNVTLLFYDLVLLSCNMVSLSCDPVSLFCHLVSLFCFIVLLFCLIVLHWHDIKLHFSNTVEHSCVLKSNSSGDSSFHRISFSMTHQIAQTYNPYLYTMPNKKPPEIRWFQIS